MVVRPGRGDLRRRRRRQHVGRAVGEPDAGARGGRLHHQLGVVGDRVLQRLVLGRDPAERRVVVGAVVQPGQPRRRRRAPSARPGRCRPARGSTAASRPGSRSAGPASRPRAPWPRPGRRWSPWAGSPPSRPGCRPRSSSVATYDVSVRSAAGAGRRLEALDPDAAERRRRARLLALGQRPRPRGPRRRPRRRRSGRRSRPRSPPAGPRPARCASLARTRATRSASCHELANASACSSSSRSAAAPYAGTRPASYRSAGT